MKKTQLLTLFNACIFTFLLSLLSSNLLFCQGSSNSASQNIGVSQNSNEVCYDRLGNQIPCEKFIKVNLIYNPSANKIYIVPPRGVFFQSLPIQVAHVISDPRSGQVITYDLINNGDQLFLNPSIPLTFDLNSKIKNPGRYTLVMIVSPDTLINFTFDKPF